MDRISSAGLCTLNQRLAKTNVFHLFGLNAVTSNVIGSICQPDELVNLHALIPNPD
jgi:hypothetical protein